MREKKIFVYKLFLSLNIKDFSLSLCENCNPPEKGHPLFPSNHPLKIEILSSSPFWKFGWRLIPPAERGRVHTMLNMNKTQIFLSASFLTAALMTSFMYEIQTMMVDYLKETLPHISKIVYFSNGCGEQYKNYKNFINFCSH